MDNMKTMFFDLEMWGQLLLPNQIKETEKDFIGNEDQIEVLNRFMMLFKALQENPKRFGMLKPRLSALLHGPPGTGKTMAVRIMAKKYQLPLLLIHSDRLISKGLGDTLHNLRTVLESSLTITRQSSTSLIIFFDELDAIASERASEHEVGEIKRAVTTFLQHVDRLLEETVRVALIGATNHAQVLDTAVWRRFTWHVRFNFPSEKGRFNILKHYLNLLQEEQATIVQLSDDDIRYLASDHVTAGYTAADIRRAIEGLLVHVILNKEITIEDIERELKRAGGTGWYYQEYTKKTITPNLVRENISKDSSMTRENEQVEKEFMDNEDIPRF